MIRTAIFPGTFNPFTIGHADIVKRGLRLFDRIIVAIGCNPGKPGATEQADARRDTIGALYADEPRVTAEVYSGLTTDFARQRGAGFILRAVRDTRDFEYERNLADINSHISDIETVLLTARPELSFVSSSAVRELASFGYDVSALLPEAGEKE